MAFPKRGARPASELLSHISTKDTCRTLQSVYTTGVLNILPAEDNAMSAEMRSNEYSFNPHLR